MIRIKLKLVSTRLCKFARYALCCWWDSFLVTALVMLQRQKVWDKKEENEWENVADWSLSLFLFLFDRCVSHLAYLFSSLTEPGSSGGFGGLGSRVGGGVDCWIWGCVAICVFGFGVLFIDLGFEFWVLYLVSHVRNLWIIMKEPNYPIDK